MLITVLSPWNTLTRASIYLPTRSHVLQDDEGQVTEPWPISAGLDYPGVGPQHAYLHDTGRSEYRPNASAAAMRAFRCQLRPRASSRGQKASARSPGDSFP